MESNSRLRLGGDYHGEPGGGPVNLALVGRGMHGGHRGGPGSVPAGGGGGCLPGEGSGSDGQEEINVEDDGPCAASPLGAGQRGSPGHISGRTTEAAPPATTAERYVQNGIFSL